MDQDRADGYGVQRRAGARLGAPSLRDPELVRVWIEGAEERPAYLTAAMAQRNTALAGENLNARYPVMEVPVSDRSRRRWEALHPIIRRKMVPSVNARTQNIVGTAAKKTSAMLLSSPVW